MEISKRFYSIFELANRWDILPCDLLHLAVDSQIVLSIRWVGDVSLVIDEDTYGKQSYLDGVLLNLAPKFAEEILIEACAGVPTGKRGQEIRLSQVQIMVDEAISDDGKKFALIASLSGGGQHGCLRFERPWMNVSNILILRKEVERFEAISTSLVKIPQGNSPGIPDTEVVEYVRGNDEIEIESGRSFNTFKKYVGLFNDTEKRSGQPEITIEQEKEKPYRNIIKKLDIRRVEAFRKQYLKN